MKLRDLFRRRTDVPDPPVPAAARHPDWPTMRPVQRVVSSPDLITAPDRFTDGLVSWRNPSQGGTLGHYVTPDAPAGVSDGLATASPRGELPAPARPRWWPQPPAVQRRVPTSMPAPEAPPPEAPPISSDDPAPTPLPAVPVYPLTGHTLVSAAGVEPPAPRLVLPAVQRHAAEPEASQAPVADPDVPGGESPPEAPLPSVVAARTEPLPDASADSWPGSRPDLPATRRLGLGAPLQRVPDAGGGPWADSAPMQRHVEVEVEPTDVAPLVSDSSPMTSVAASSIPSAAVDTAPHPDPGPVWSPSAEPTTATPLPTVATPTGAEPSPVQRQTETEAEPRDVAPLVSDTPPMASVVTPSAAVPPAEPATGSRSTGPSPSPQSVQRAVDTPLQPGTGPMRSPSPEPTAATPLLTTATPTGAEPSPVQRQTETEAEVEPLDVAPLVSDSPPIASVAGSPTPSGPVVTPPPASPLVATPSTKPAAGSGSAGPSSSAWSPSRSTVPGLAVQRTIDTPRQPGPRPVWSPSAEVTAATPLPAAAAPTGAGPSTAQRQAEAEPMEVAPLVSGSPPMASVVIPSAVTPSTDAAAGSRSAGPSPSAGSSTRSSEPGLPVQRAVDTPSQRESTDISTPTIALPLPDLDHADARRTVSYDSMAPPVMGLVGDRPIEPVVTGYAAAPAAEQTRGPAVQRRSTAEGQGRTAYVSGPAVLAATAVQRSIDGSANPPAQWPPGALAVGRSSPGVGQQALPTQPVQFAAAAPVAAESNPPELSTELVVQRADDEAAAATGPPTPPTATGAPTATGPAAGTPPASPIGSTSPTEVDTLVRRLYDPIVRRLKAELQLDRERAGHSLDLRH